MMSSADSVISNTIRYSDVKRHTNKCPLLPSVHPSIDWKRNKAKPENAMPWIIDLIAYLIKAQKNECKM